MSTVIAPILDRLSVAWFALASVIVAGLVLSGGRFDGFTYGVLVAPSALGLVLAWVFLPAKR